MRYRWSRLSTIGGVVSALAGIIGAIIPLLLDHKGFPLHTVLIYGGIVVAVVAIGALVSWIWSRIRRRLLKVRISGDATLAGVPDESYEVTKDSGKLATEDVRLKEYRTKRDEAEKELGLYLPANPRGAKRLINHERLYSQIAEDRHIFGGTPELNYRHLAKWVLIIEHWPGLGAALTREPDKIRALENCTNMESLQNELNTIDTHIRATDELLNVLSKAIPLSLILGRLVRFEPSITSLQETTSQAPEPVILAANPTEQSETLGA